MRKNIIVIVIIIKKYQVKLIVQWMMIFVGKWVVRVCTRL